MCKFNLVPTNVYATLGTDEKAAKRKNWPFEWRIEGVQPAEMRVTADAAIRYVTRMRDKTTAAVIKKKADQTLAKLMRLR
jgi:hypothetical protein